MNYSGAKVRERTSASWNSALLLSEFIKAQFENEKGLAVTPSYAYHYESGKFFAISNKRCVPTAPWDNVVVSETGNTRLFEARVQLDNVADLILKKRGFCLISGELINGTFPADWHKTAKCTCLDFLEVNGQPCVHILCLSLLLNKMLRQKERLKMNCGEAALNSLQDAQIAVELGLRRGYKYPNGPKCVNEFVHQVCILTAQRSSQYGGETHRQQLERCDPVVELKRALLNAEQYIDEATRKSKQKAVPITCEATTLLLQGMRSDRFRALVLSKPHPSRPRPVALPTSKRFSTKKSSQGVLKPSFSSEEKVPSEAKKLKLNKRKTATTEAVDEARNMAEVLADTQPKSFMRPMKRTRSDK